MMNIIFPIMFVVVFMFIAFAFVQVISTWNKNNHSPRLTVPAVVVAKLEKIHVLGTEYGMLAEGDSGRLSFQGTRYLSFER